MADERDEQRFLGLVREAAAALDIPVWTWSLTRGLARDAEDPQYQTREPLRALAFVAQIEGPGVFVFLDAQPTLADPTVVRQLKEIAGRARRGQTIVLAGSSLNPPGDLSAAAIAWKLNPPTSEDLEDVVRRTIGSSVLGSSPFTSTQKIAAPWSTPSEGSPWPRPSISSSRPR
jgi:hypothetical protein